MPRERRRRAPVILDAGTAFDSAPSGAAAPEPGRRRGEAAEAHDLKGGEIGGIDEDDEFAVFGAALPADGTAGNAAPVGGQTAVVEEKSEPPLTVAERRRRAREKAQQQRQQQQEQVSAGGERRPEGLVPATNVAPGLAVEVAPPTEPELSVAVDKEVAEAGTHWESFARSSSGDSSNEVSDSDVEDDDDSSSEESGSAAENKRRWTGAFVPTFRTAGARATLREADAREAAETRELELKEQRQLELASATRGKVADLVKRRAENDGFSDDDMGANAVGDEGLSDTDSETEAVERQRWRLREGARVRRHAEEKRAALEQELELQRRRAMTDAEIMAEDADRFAADRNRKKNYAYMQKYYHAGAFFRTFDDEDITRQWDFSQPVLEDRQDKSALPEALQVRRNEFGKAGRTKYTNLKDQDTSDRSSLFAQSVGNNNAQRKRRRE